jgi:putative tryptophan/tyrosine transport system substrate-binding protein
MKRREFIAGLGGAAAWPAVARAQQPGMPVVGFLNASSDQNYAPQKLAFLKGLEETGYVDRRNVVIEYRWADNKNDRLAEMAADLVRRQVAVIAATSAPASVAAKAATTTIPIVFETGGDPIQLGLVDSLNRPGGNVTGVTQLNIGLAQKRLELLHEVLPSVRVFALLVDPRDPDSANAAVNQVLSAARTFGLGIHVLNASSEADFDSVFTRFSQLGAGGLVMGGGPFLVAQREQLAGLSLRHRVPAASEHREFAAAGGLLSYGSDITDAYRLAGIYVGRILKGDKPADLPVQQAVKIQFFINLKTAKALGITIPLPLLGRADEVIE